MNNKLIKIKSVILLAPVVLFLAGFFYWKNIVKENILDKNESLINKQTVNQNQISQQDKYQFFYNKVETSIKQKDEKTADFWLARYFSLAYNTDQVHDATDNLIPLLNEYKVSSPTSFLSGKYDTEFISWFVNAPYGLWDFNEVNQGLDMDTDISFQFAAVKDGNYVALVYGGYPYLEGRNIIDLPDSGTQTAILVLGNPDKELYLYAGETEEGSNEAAKSYGIIEIDLGENPLQYIWQPEFYDLDDDNIPEIWVRYNKTTADGFIQELAIYKIKNNNELYLFKKFTGKAEGIARRVNGNQVEVGEGIAGSSSEGHLNYSKFRLETWEFKNGVFRKITEKTIPHILLGSDWSDYYEN